VGLLLVLVVAKLLATGLTLGSGASGGVFSPCLFLGATFGGACGLILQRALPDLGVNPVDFAIVGMAGMIAASTGGLITSIVMLFEMTRDYNVILPLILTVSVAYVVRRKVSRGSIYTLKLLRRGHIVPEGLIAARDVAHRASDVMSRDIIVVGADTPLDRASRDDSSPTDPVIVVEHEGRVLGVLQSRPRLYGAGATELTFRDVARKDFVFVGEDKSLVGVLAAKEDSGASMALVARRHSAREARDVVGAITHTEIALTARSAARLFR